MSKFIEDRLSTAKALWYWWNHPKSDGFYYKLFELMETAKGNEVYFGAISSAFPVASELWSSLKSSEDTYGFFEAEGAIEKMQNIRGPYYEQNLLAKKEAELKASMPIEDPYITCEKEFKSSHPNESRVQKEEKA